MNSKPNPHFERESSEDGFLVLEKSMESVCPVSRQDDHLFYTCTTSASDQAVYYPLLYV